jgi:hypothetical protein
LRAHQCAVAKLLLIILVVTGLANSLVADRSQAPLLVDNATASPLDARP